MPVTARHRVLLLTLCLLGPAAAAVARAADPPVEQPLPWLSDYAEIGRAHV